jgi:hypothetical protein
VRCTKLVVVWSVVWSVGCGNSRAELRCVSGDGTVAVNERHDCVEYCESGADLLVIAEEECGADATCGCAFTPDEECEAWLEGRECQL